ncbi:hypothetical protein Bphyt_0853 [Paraburkholderia phytofirmans PsJN]|uniref:Uncharacterized protein n=1 Tax=Paraburkholderia phytofirmans (strain DSM 17436 / LMG 22146 / PsJN) TaxID=398527 RepID=B2T0H0_PARPJ|nr:hypothetical protein Bphyt_0853 [Paraburkholderia phytofirmans PsJN]
MGQHEFFLAIIDMVSVDGGQSKLTSNFWTKVCGLYVTGPFSAHTFGSVMWLIAPRWQRVLGGATGPLLKAAWRTEVASSGSHPGGLSCPQLFL